MKKRFALMADGAAIVLGHRGALGYRPPSAAGLAEVAYASLAGEEPLRSAPHDMIVKTWREMVRGANWHRDLPHFASFREHIYQIGIKQLVRTIHEANRIAERRGTAQEAVTLINDRLRHNAVFRA